MKTIQMRIDEQVDAFVGNLQQIMREAALEAVERATHSKSAVKTRRRMSAKRDPEQLGKLTEQLYGAICEHPGESMKALSQATGCTPRELGLCARRLIGQGRVKKAGQRQYTRYFPAGADEASSHRNRRR
jgi:H2-forming N5,N10-methylenetetrahydromethanopterin dehydrogenase-like enzyme